MRQGAALITTAQEVIEETGWTLQVSAESARDISQVMDILDPESNSILETISARSHQLDEIVILTCLTPQQVSQLLISLQLRGFVRQGPDGYIRLL